MKDSILEKFFEKDRWHDAIDTAYEKGLNKKLLYDLCKPEGRARLYECMASGGYAVAPPHTAKIPKDTPGEFRTVYVNEATDRIVLSIANDLLFELMPEMVHKSCKSYQTGLSCAIAVQEISTRIVETDGDVVGFKSDLSKYFDSVPIEYIDGAFDIVEQKYGKSVVIDILRRYYHSDWYWNDEGELVEQYQSLKQGCAVAAWLADVVLYHVDERLSRMNGKYCRYSDDIMFIGKDYIKAMDVLKEELNRMQMHLNPKKVEYISKERWVKFLGFSIKGQDITISPTRLKKFQKEIEERTVKNRRATFASALASVNRYLYKGRYSWGSAVLGTFNVDKDIDTLNGFIMDALRAVKTGKKKIGGLGYVATQKEGCIQRGKGRNVKENKKKMPHIDGYLSIGCMQAAKKTSAEAYKTLASSL